MHDQDDGSPMMSCGKCFKWQHIACHDLADERAGRSKRIWDSVEFVCQQCRSRMFAGVDSTFENIRYNRHSVQGMNPSSPSNNLTTYQACGTSEVTPQAPILAPLYHTANGSDPIRIRPYSDLRTQIPDQYSTAASQTYITTQYIQFPSANAFSHYQPREGRFSPSVKSQSQPSYQVEYDQRFRTQQHTTYNDLHSSAHVSNQRSTVSVSSCIRFDIQFSEGCFPGHPTVTISLERWDIEFRHCVHYTISRYYAY